MRERTTVPVDKRTRDRLAKAKYDLEVANYDAAVSELLDLYEAIENPNEIPEN